MAWSDYKSPNGFGYGLMCPFHAFQLREVAVATVNALAAQLGSVLQYAAFDDPIQRMRGYNWCQVRLVPRSWPAGQPVPDGPTRLSDAAMDLAEALLEELWNDVEQQLVVVQTATIAPTFGGWLGMLDATELAAVCGLNDPAEVRA